MRVIGVDLSTFAIDFVSVHVDGLEAPVWERFPLVGTDAFDRARNVADALPGRHSTYYEDVLAIGIEHPAGRHGVGPLLRIQGAVLATFAPNVLVQPWPPGKWRKAVGLAGNTSKADVATWATWEGGLGQKGVFWEQDAIDAWCLALATRAAITQQAAA